MLCGLFFVCFVCPRVWINMCVLFVCGCVVLCGVLCVCCVCVRVAMCLCMLFVACCAMLYGLPLTTVVF